MIKIFDQILTIWVDFKNRMVHNHNVNMYF